jgi:AcrR family transcriptional regulator
MVKKSIRPRGRPRTFDEDEAIRKATDVFWAKGFDAASIDDLVEAMGVQRPSLYAIFGDKATLFIRCLDAYQIRFRKRVIEALTSPMSVHGAISALLRISVENATGKGTPSGCLFVCVAPLVDNDYVRSYLPTVFTEMTTAVAKRLREGVESGELPIDFPCDSRARIMIDLSRGLVVRARIGISREELLNDAEDQASLVLSYYPSSITQE